MFRNYLLISFRQLRKNLLTSGLNIAGLATGIAVCLFIAVWLERELSYDDFHPDGDRIYRIVNTFTSESESFSQAPSGPALGAQLPDNLPEIEAACRYFDGAGQLTVGDKKFFEEDIQIADSSFFHFFNFPLLQGLPGEVLSEVDQIVLTESLAKKYFGNYDPVGQTIQYGEDEMLTVSGVAADPPANSQIQFSAIIPMDYMYRYAEENYGGFNINEMWVGGWMYTYVRLRNPAEWQESEVRVNAVVAEHSKEAWEENQMSYTYALQPLRDIHLDSDLRYDLPSNGSRARVWMFGSVGLMVLLLACINYMNLATAGALKRAKETGIRKVVGARRSELVRQFLTDSVTMVFLSTAIGLLLFRLFLPAFSDLTGQTYQFAISWGNVLILLGFALGLGVLSGLYPAFVLSGFKPVSILKGSFQRNPEGVWMRKGLVVFQFVTTMVLIAGIMIIRQQMSFVQSKELGYQGDAVISVNYRGFDAVNRQMETLRSELLKSPAILATARHGGNVVGGLGNDWTTTENLEGEEISTSAYILSADPDYFATYGMELAAGRFFSGSIATDSTKAVLVNEAAVRTFGWEKPENAIGKPFGKGDNTRRVVGVVKDFHFESLHKPVEALVISFARSGSRLSLRVDRANVKDAVRHLETTWQRMLPDLPLDYAFVDSQVAEQYGNEQVMGTLFLLFSSLSLFIACLGLFGLVTFMAEQKVKEIGIRKVLGATVSGIVALLSRDFLKLVLIAMLIAAPLAWYFMERWLQDFAYRIDIHWWVFVLAGATAMAIALLTVGLRSLKAAFTNPVESLRSE
ncbi:ABC transporter permease [Flavilitoribacter nigricans]|uniref:ABC transporter permease n=1 Tax=Flavilitoribacter nigricans (strain ATCC 23147 / DSM 23189 / NBRC 102662 / NCIMB 1420 / SS-2) TaxID=1122177 RepID=A0A2D0N6N3_FLAN2|nr:ABC transporter permease [Flavilitoribacter nigricans]PHN04117.1 hypothetical protein CRP01_23255 [Flavilitoribacter nigricans DSM 23189 = NBRC 102662]